MTRTAAASTRRKTAVALALASLFGSSAAFAAAGDRIGDAITVDARLYENHSVVASDSAGEFIVAWNQDTQIFARLYAADGTAAGPAFFVAQSTDHEPPRVAMRADGGFIVTWAVHSNPGPSRGLVTSAKSSIYARRFAPGGAPIGDAFLVADLGDRASVAMDDDGDFVIGWASDRRREYIQFGYPFPTRDVPSLGATSIKVQRFHADGTTAGPVQTLHERLLFGSFGPENAIAVTMAPSGAYTAVYSLKKAQADVTSIYAQQFAANGRPAGTPIQITDGATESSGPSAVNSRSGDLVVTWNDASGGHYKSYTSTGAVRFAAASPFVDVSTSGNYPASGLAIDPNGNFVIVGTPPIALAAASVVTRFFGPDGTPLSGTKPVAPNAGFLQIEPAVAMDGQGNAVAAWTNYAILPNIQAIQAQSIGAQQISGP